jgi:hypothetical protein
MVASECPVEPHAQRWLESSWRWFVDEFGATVLRRDPVLPSAPFLSEKGYSAPAEQVEALIGRLCELMLVDRRLITLELFDGSDEKKQAALTGRTRAVGHFRVEDGRAVISLDQSESADRELLTAIAVHELCHLRLLGERRIRRDRQDGERLTDLLTVYFGFGILATNAAMRFARADRGWSAVPLGELDDITLNAARRDGYHRLGYLSSAEFGYALACYCWLRGEKDPSWARYVNPGPLLHLKQGLAFLAGTSAAGELPTQRLLGQAVKIGNATVRVTRGQRIGPASLGLMVADPAADSSAVKPHTERRPKR